MSALGAVTPTPTWPALITTLLEGGSLSRTQTAWAMDRVMTGEATTGQLAGFLVALRAKGESVDEIAGLVDTMVQHAVRITVPGHCTDVVGTGGDRHHTVNISTTAAIVVAATGHRVVKHGNRATSSASGAADVLEALGVELNLPPQRVTDLATEVGITFCFAQVFHPAFRHAATARRELGVPTAFNFLGPLTNPAQPAAAAVGVADARMAGVMAGVMAQRGTSALVFHGDDGLDELSTTSRSRVWVVDGGQVIETGFDPQQVGLPRAALDELRGGDARHNADVIRGVLAGRTGPIRDVVLLNAAAALVAADRNACIAVLGAPVPEHALATHVSEALQVAAHAVDSGAATALLDRWVKASAASSSSSSGR